MFLAGCTASQTNDRHAASPRQLTLAVTDAVNPELLQEYEPFRQKLASLLKTNINFFPVESYTAAAIALQQGKVDLALTGPAEYVAIRARTNAIPIIALTRPNYYSIIIKTANSEIQSLAELKGKTISMGPVGSTSSYLGPTYLLVQAGLDPKTDITIKNLDKEGLDALQKQEVVAWCGSLTDYQRFLQDRGLSATDFPIIAQSEPLPSDIFVVNSQLDPQFIEQLRQIMLSERVALIEALATVDGGKYQEAQFQTAEDSDYDLIREAYKAIGQGNFF
jgi:phosphonate transport system substrate-binding protein